VGLGQAESSKLRRCRMAPKLHSATRLQASLLTLLLPSELGAILSTSCEPASTADRQQHTHPAAAASAAASLADMPAPACGRVPSRCSWRLHHPVKLCCSRGRARLQTATTAATLSPGGVRRDRRHVLCSSMNPRMSHSDTSQVSSTVSGGWRRVRHGRDRGIQRTVMQL
jgi:hypothetical protein